MSAHEENPPRNQGNVHATGMVLGGRGVMVRGPSGAGKSLLVLEALERWELRGLSALLVADDRLDLALSNGHLTMEAPKTIAGLIELRGRGIVRRPYQGRAQVHLVVDLVEGLERMVEEDALSVRVLGISVPRCPVPQRGVIDSAHQLLLIREALQELDRANILLHQKTT